MLASLRTVRNNFAALTNLQQDRTSNKWVQLRQKFSFTIVMNSLWCAKRAEEETNQMYCVLYNALLLLCWIFTGAPPCVISLLSQRPPSQVRWFPFGFYTISEMQEYLTWFQTFKLCFSFCCTVLSCFTCYFTFILCKILILRIFDCRLWYLNAVWDLQKL